jgi:hypothetical protein
VYKLGAEILEIPKHQMRNINEKDLGNSQIYEWWEKTKHFFFDILTICPSISLTLSPSKLK